MLYNAVHFWLMRVRPRSHTHEPKIVISTILFNIAFNKGELYAINQKPS